MSDTAEDTPATPVCLRCLTPYDRLQHYCPNCGTAVGTFTPYIPFVDIPFSYSLADRLWRTIWDDPAASTAKKAFYWLIIVLWVPIMLIGIPFMLRRRARNSPQGGAPP